MKTGMVVVITAESFILVAGKLIILGQSQLTDGILATLLELNADTVAFVCNTGFSGINIFPTGIFTKRQFPLFLQI